MSGGRPQNVHLKPAQPGEVRNPRGRQKGSRNKLGEAFLQALHDDFLEHGSVAIVTVRVDKPDAYLKIIASTLPQKLEIERVDNMTDDERRNRIREIAEQLGAVVNLGLVAGASATDGGGEAGAEPEQAPSVSTLQ